MKKHLNFRFLIILFTIGLIRLFSSCCTEHINCELVFKGFLLENMDNSGKEPILSNLPINKKAYVIRANFSIEDESWIYSQLQSLKNISSTANAMSCGEVVTYYYQVPITDILLTVDKDFDANHPTGKSLNDLFAVSVNYKENQSLQLSPFQSINSFVAELMTSSDKQPNQVYFFLNSSPKDAGEYTFTMTIKLEDETVFINTITVELI